MGIATYLYYFDSPTHDNNRQFFNFRLVFYFAVLYFYLQEVLRKCVQVSKLRALNVFTIM